MLPRSFFVFFILFSYQLNAENTHGIVDTSLNITYEPYIFNGFDALAGELPWVVSLSSGPATRRHLCGASLIGDKWLLTAAHCFQRDQGSIPEPTNFSALVGTNLLRTGGRLVSLKHICIHKDFVCPKCTTNGKQLYDNDIAILELNDSVSEKTITFASNSTESELLKIATGVAVGWGLTQSFIPSNSLKVSQSLPIVDQSECDKQKPYHGRLSDNMICAGFSDGHSDSCPGDSGGPFLIRNPQGDFVQEGIVSWGDKCGTTYGIYTRVARFSDWINDRIKNNNRSICK